MNTRSRRPGAKTDGGGYSPRKIAPAPGKPRNVLYPEIPDYEMRNGLRVLVVQDHRLPRVSVRIGLPFGRVHGPEENLALPGMTLDLLEEGTENRDSRELAAELDQYAIQFQSEVLMEYTLFAMTVLEQHLEKGVELLSEILLRPSFPELELEKVRARWKSSLLSERTEPDFLARERTFHTIFDGHPYRRVSVPLDHVQQLTRGDVESFFKTGYFATGTLLLFSGPIDLPAALTLAEKYFGEWEPGERPQLQYPAVKPLKERVVRLVHRPRSVQVRIVVSGRVPSRPDPELLQFRVANQVLGGGASSRLFLNLRENKGYTYGAYSSIRTYTRDGLFMATADVNSQQATAALQETLDEIERMRQEPPQPEELQRSRAELIGSFIRQMETSSLVGYLELHKRLNFLPENYFSQFIPTINGIDPNQVQEVSGRYFDGTRLVITVVGDRKDLETDLHKFGDLEVHNSDGNRLSG